MSIVISFIDRSSLLAGRPAGQGLVGELATRSEEFRTLWAAHNVRLHHTGTKNFHHPLVGDLSLPFEAMPLPADPGLTLTAFSAEPGTAAHDGFTLLAGWASTLQQNEPAHESDQTRTPGS